jgi:hypothetical protein
VLIRATKNFFIQKFNMGKKTQNCTLISSPLKKFVKNALKYTICTFTHVRQTCFVNNFFVCFF